MKALLKALLAAQAEITNPIKNASNPHFRNRYADLSSVLESVQEPLNKHGLVLTQTLKQSDGSVLLVTTLWHAETGESMESWIALNPAKQDPQGYAAACTYYRRLSIKAMCGLAEVDDDGNEASQPKTAPSRAVAMVKEKMAPSDLSIIEVAAGMRESKTMKDLDVWASRAKTLTEAEKADARAIYAQRKSELEVL